MENQKGFKNLLDKSITTREVIFLLAVVLCLSPLISPPIALLMGLIIAQFIGHPYLHLNHKATHILLQVSVVGLGFGMNVTSALKAGKEGILFTIVSIIGTLAIGFFMGKFLKIEKKDFLFNISWNSHLWWKCYCCYFSCNKGRGKTDIGCIRNHIYSKFCSLIFISFYWASVKFITITIWNVVCNCYSRYQFQL
ncbi:Uncharacterised protein [Chryseobacterium carnipullorum]|uniref:Sulfate exporter family transporter n=1 Tax=Chryseobacterium carnipullorum TaxID=1124835 RepID=A0A376DTG1_CHRCU|nr:Uncharacterised protein [Chryseobacterium carnipullorum]